ncbi:unnamed protein product [Cladocopium goreaui]|uniref:USP domain-containing protein n=1 Tax=Cladocopium goreaui TaxID=2562237 RepID=A0A9P1CTD2_9DINO|nr:unnamed protein product [Cladocopium goreaui]
MQGQNSDEDHICYYMARKRRLERVYQVAGEASQARDHFRLYQAIRQLAPKQQFCRLQIRSSDGNIMTPGQEADLLAQWFTELYQDTESPPALPFNWPFTSSEFCEGLRSLPLRKALAPEYVPSPFWKLTAQQVSTYLDPALHEWSSNARFPQCWSDGTLVFLPKTKKRTQTPSELRPISLLEPCGKSVMGMCASQILAHTWQELQRWPQFAYLPARGVDEALHRILQHCRRQRDSQKRHCLDPHDVILLTPAKDFAVQSSLIWEVWHRRGSSREEEWHKGPKTIPLRHTLAVSMMMVLEERLTKLANADTASDLFQACIQQNLITKEKTMPSEGCIPAMGNAETSPDWTQILQSLPDVKQHGPQPEMCVSTPMALNLRQASKVVKRSLLRAQRRAECFGMTWYRGKCLTLADFAKMGMPPTYAMAQAPRIQDVMSCHSHNKPKKRLTCLSWNGGGLASSKLDEIKTWLCLQQVQVAVLTETRWSFQSTWSDNAWHHIHSADPNHRGSGVLILISRSLCHSNDLRWNEIIPGRLVHVRVMNATRNLDILGCYQHVYKKDKEQLQKRDKFWQTLETQLTMLPGRNTVALMGDFNCSLPTSAGVSGPSSYTWNQQQAVGHAMQLRRQRFAETVQEAHAAALHFDTRKLFDIINRVPFDIGELASALSRRSLGCSFRLLLPRQMLSSDAGPSGRFVLADRPKTRWPKWLPIVENLTIYADDFHVGGVFRSCQDLQLLLECIGMLFELLAEFDLSLNPQKSVAILHMTGSQSRKMRALHTQRDQHGERIKIPVGNTVTLVLQPGPDFCLQKPAVLPMMSSTPSQSSQTHSTGTRLLTATDLDLLRSKSWGDSVLHMIATDTLHNLEHEWEACQYLSKQCFLCGLQLSRTQDMNLHYRTEHAAHWTNVPSKAMMLTNIHSSESPCPHCGGCFRKHQCPVWTQIAVIVLNGGGLMQPEPMEVAPTHRCDICLAPFTDAAQLTQHLQEQHNLAGISFNVARDSLNSEAACAHCGSVHTSMEGLRTHITRGHCPSFNPEATAETTPITKDWLDICLHGCLLEHLQPPMRRLQLSIRCQQCAQAYTRAGDLANHLMTCHSRQIGMMFHRLQSGLFMPVQIPDAVIHQMVHHSIPDDIKQRIARVFIDRSFSDLWTDQAMKQILRSWCVLCGQEHHPGLLCRHLHEAHVIGHRFADFYNEALFPILMHEIQPDHCCTLCGQIFNLPALTPSDASAAGRLELVQVHLRGNCPGDLVMSGWDEGALGQIRDTFQFLQPILDKGLALTPNPRAPKQRRTDQQKGQQADPDQPEHDPQFNLMRYLQLLGLMALRQEHSLSVLQSTDSFILFFQPEEGGTLQGLIAETKKWTQQRQQGPQQLQTPLRQHLSQWMLTDLLNRATKVSKCKQGDPVLQACLDKRLLLEDLSWPYLRWNAEQKALVVDKKKSVTMPKMLQHLEELIQDFRDPGLVLKFQSLQTSQAQTERQTLRAAVGTLPLLHLAADGSNTATSLTQTEQPGHPGKEHDAQDKGPWERQEPQQDPGHRLTESEICSLCNLAVALTFANDSNWCFANVTLYCLLWALLSLKPADASSWGPRFEHLMQLLQNSLNHEVQLIDLPWFAHLLKDLGRTPAQQDCSEFVHILLQWVSSPAIDMSWHRRCETDAGTIVSDQSQACMPLFLQIPANLAFQTNCTLEDLLQHWCQVDGMRAAMLQAAKIICIHVDRLVSTSGQIEKSSCAIDVDTGIAIPHFVEDTLHQATAEYVLIAAAAHLGIDAAGHYQAILKVQPAVISSSCAVQWLITQDHCKPKPVWEVPNTLKQNLNVLWLMRADSLRLPGYHCDTETTVIEPEAEEALEENLLMLLRTSTAETSIAPSSTTT